MRKKIITIAGPPGSGKSTTAKKVAERLSYNHFSSGDLFRNVASEHGVDILKINQIAETQEEIDYFVDEKLRTIGKTENNLVIDSRTAFHWIPDSYKVYLKLDPCIASERIFNQIQQDGRKSQDANTIEEVKLDIESRISSELKRYKKLYDLDYTIEDHYDLVIDSGKASVEMVTDMILDAYKKKHLF